jgi:hypothetical protein
MADSGRTAFATADRCADPAPGGTVAVLPLPRSQENVMTRATTDPGHSPASVDVPRRADARLAGSTLMAGCALAAIGFASISVGLRGSGDARYTDPLWQPLYGVLLAGSLLVVLGLPAVLAVHGGAFRRLTLVGYVGIFAPLVMLNVAETTIEAFVMPYLAKHGGTPPQTPAGLNAFEGVALLLLIVGAVCLAIAVFRARIMPLWVGGALLASVVCAFLLHGGAVAFISDYLILAALFCFGLYAARPTVGTSPH